MSSPGQASYYAQPDPRYFSNATQYVNHVHGQLRAAVAGLGVQLPGLSASNNQFTVPGYPGLRFTVATSPQEAAARYRRIQDVVQQTAAFNAWRASLGGLDQGQPASQSAVPAPLLTTTRFQSVQAVLTVHYVEPGDQDNVQYDTTNPITLTPTALRLLSELGPQEARDQVWIAILGESIYWGDDVVVGVSLNQITSVQLQDRSITAPAQEVSQNLRNISAALAPRRTRSQARASSRVTRSGRRFGNGPPAPVLRPNRRDFNPMNYRSQNSSAPVPCSSLMSQFDLDAFRRNMEDATEIYRSDYMRTMPKEEKRNMCWFSAVCDLVNYASGGIVVDFDCLLNHLNYFRFTQQRVAHTLQSVQDQGLSIEDMVPIFKFFEKEVLVFNVADELVFRSEGSRGRRKRMKPYNWVFLVAHGHVYPIHDYNSSKHQQNQVNRHGSLAFANSVVKSRDEYTDSASPLSFMFPYYLRQPSKDLRLTAPDVPEVQRLVHVLYRDTNLHNLLIQPRHEHKGRTVVVLLDRKDDLTALYLDMVRDFNHRPEAFFMKDNMVQISSTIHGHYQGLIFKRMSYLNTKKDPDMVTDVDQFLMFERRCMEFRRILYKTDHLSFVNASTFDLFEKMTRTPLVGPIPGADKSKLRDCCAVDFNRLYGYALQSLTHVPILFPYSKFIIPTSAKKADFPANSFVIGKVHGKRTAYLHEEYALLYYPNLRDHMNKNKRRQIVFDYNPVFGHSFETTFEVMLYCEVTQMAPLGNSIKTYMRNFWDQAGIPKSGKKAMINTSIGMLGTKRNDLKAFNKGIIVESPDELSMLGENYSSENYNIFTMDDNNFAVLPAVHQCVNRYQTGMMLYQTIVDAAVLHVANFVDVMTRDGIEALQVQTDEIYFPASDLPKIEKYLYEGNNTDFEANGMLKLSKDGSASFELPTSPTLDLKTDYGSLLKSIVEVQRTQPRFADYEQLPVSVDISEFQRVLLTASVPGAGKTYRVASQVGVTGVIAVPTNALAVDIKAKFPQHNVITIHKLLSMVGRAFGLLDSLKDKEEIPANQEGDDEEKTVPMKIFREGDTFLCIDEIYMLPTQVLLALYHFLHFLPKAITHVYATGDPYQLDPVEDRRTVVNSGRAREAMIIRMFQKRINLTRCRRMNTEELNRRVEVFCAFLRTNRGLQSPALRIQALTSVCQEHNVHVVREYHEIIDIMKAQPDMLVAAYTNDTCHKITKHVLGSLEAKLVPGVRLINRKRMYVRGGHRMHLNYLYEVKDYNPDLNTVNLVEIKAEDMTDEDEDLGFWVDADHVLKHMHWHRTRTAHCLQGTSWNGGVIVCDTDRNHLVNRAFFYVTMTRARDFDRLYVYIPYTI